MRLHYNHNPIKAGFTLIELSIVLVVIGLIVGGVMVGKDLINASTIRSQISQIEKYNTSINTFRLKYGALPGDMKNADAVAFGFATRGTGTGDGDNNGILEASHTSCGITNGLYNMGYGETLMFWADLSSAQLIDGNFSTANWTSSATTDQKKYLPLAKISSAGYVYVYHDGGATISKNHFGINPIDVIDPSSGCIYYNNPSSHRAISVVQAYNIDKKIDDGFPRTGTVTTIYIDNESIGYSAEGAAIPSSSVCSNGLAIQQYTMGYNNGSGLNCALSFTFQ